jgi:hypothetical protein
MTQHTPLSYDMYINAYLSEISHDMRSARESIGPWHALRKSIASSLVRSGAWLLPDKPQVIGGTVIVLSETSSDDHRKAA